MAFPHWGADEATLSLYVTELGDVGPEYVEQAVREWIRSERDFPPTAGQLRTKARELRWETLNRVATETQALEGPRERRAARGTIGTLTEMLSAKSAHWRYWLDKSRRGRDYAPVKQVPSAQFAFPPRGTECPCSECHLEFKARPVAS